MNFIYVSSLLLVVTIQLVNCTDIINLKTYPGGWQPSSTSTYKVLHQTVTSEAEAEAACIKSDAKSTLAIIHEKTDYDAITAFFGNSTKLDFYIGLKYDKQSSKWQWYDGSGPIGFHPWGPETDITGQTKTCVTMVAGKGINAVWDTNECKDNKTDVVCQISVPTIVDVFTMLADMKKDIASLNEIKTDIATMKKDIATLNDMKKDISTMKQECQIAHK